MSRPIVTAFFDGMRGGSGFVFFLVIVVHLLQLAVDLTLGVVEFIERYLNARVARQIGLIVIEDDELECRLSPTILDFFLETHLLAVLKEYRCG